MEEMGRQKLADKSIDPIQQAIQAMQTGTYTIAQALQMFSGIIPIGDYKGSAALFDLDLLVKQPLVEAEQMHILGILDGREEDYDLQTVTIPNGSAINVALTGSLAVPAGEVWYVNAVRMISPADAGGSPAMNWHCSLWEDRAATPNPAGQPFHAAAVNFTPGGGTQWDEFCWPANIWAAANKPNLLRLPAGTVITFTVVNTAGVATADMACTLALFGFIGRSLVD